VVDGADSLVGRDVLVDGCPEAVGRVVDEDEFSVVDGLGVDALDGPGHSLGPIVYRNDDADRQLAHGHTTVARRRRSTLDGYRAGR
jgi:glyoxylase-like metal-dependent hydrolase (beta-lactamase superfamily II)